MDKEDAKLKRKRAEMQAINAQKRSEREAAIVEQLKSAFQIVYILS